MSVVVRSFVSPLASDAPRSRWFRLPFSLVRVRCWSFAFTLIACGGFVLFFLFLAPRVGVGLCPARRRFRLSCRRLRPALGVGFGRPRGVGCGPSRFALVLVACGGFVLFPPLFGASRWSTQATK